MPAMTTGRTLLARSIAPSRLSSMGGLSEPLISKNEKSADEEQDGAPILLSSISVIIGSVLLGAAG